MGLTPENNFYTFKTPTESIVSYIFCIKSYVINFFKNSIMDKSYEEHFINKREIHFFPPLFAMVATGKLTPKFTTQSLADSSQ